MLTILLQIHAAIASISHCEQSEQCREAAAPRPCHSPSASPPYTRLLTFMSRRAGDRRTRERTACASYALLSPHFSDLSSTEILPPKAWGNGTCSHSRLWSLLHPPINVCTSVPTHIASHHPLRTNLPDGCTGLACMGWIQRPTGQLGFQVIGTRSG